MLTRHTIQFLDQVPPRAVARYLVSEEMRLAVPNSALLPFMQVLRINVLRRAVHAHVHVFHVIIRMFVEVISQNSHNSCLRVFCSF